MPMPTLWVQLRKDYAKKNHILLFLELIQVITWKSLFSFTSAGNSFVLYGGAVLPIYPNLGGFV